MVAVVGGVLAALVGIWAFGLWKMIADGQMASKVIKHEILENVVKLDMAMGGWAGEFTLSDEAWKAHRMAIVPVLSELEWFQLCRDIGFLPQAQIWLDALLKNPCHDDARGRLDEWRNDLCEQKNTLSNAGYRNRLRLMFGLLIRSRNGEESALATDLEAMLAAGESASLPGVAQS